MQPQHTEVRFVKDAQFLHVIKGFKQPIRYQVPLELFFRKQCTPTPSKHRQGKIKHPCLKP